MNQYETLLRTLPVHKSKLSLEVRKKLRALAFEGHVWRDAASGFWCRTLSGDALLRQRDRVQ